MNGGLDAAQHRWWDSGPLSPESLKLLLDWREAGLAERPTDLIFAGFVRKLNQDQKNALVGVLELVDRDEAFRWF